MKGVAEYSENRFLDAKITFTELLIFNPNTELTIDKVSPKIVLFFNDIKSSLEKINYNLNDKVQI